MSHILTVGKVHGVMPINDKSTRNKYAHMVLLPTADKLQGKYTMLSFRRRDKDLGTLAMEFIQVDHVFSSFQRKVNRRRVPGKGID